MGELAKRALTGAAYVALTLGAAMAGPVTTTLLFLPVCLLAAREFHSLAWRNAGNAPSLAIPLFAAAMTYLAVALSGFMVGWTPAMALVVVMAVFLIAVTDILARSGPDPAKELGILLSTLVYIALPFALAPSFLGDGPRLFIGFMLLLWTNDTGAYLAGRAFGRTKLMPHVSPKKTVEGTLGGAALAVSMGYLLAHAWPVLSMAEWTVCAAVVAVLATLGDLLESALKRAAGMKDSGTILPGHGGILDRFDGFLLAAPGMLVCIHLLH